MLSLSGTHLLEGIADNNEDFKRNELNAIDCVFSTYSHKEVFLPQKVIFLCFFSTHESIYMKNNCI